MKKYVVLRSLSTKQIFWTMNTEDNVHSFNGELWYEELLFTDDKLEAIKFCS